MIAPEFTAEGRKVLETADRLVAGEIAEVLLNLPAKEAALVAKAMDRPLDARKADRHRGRAGLRPKTA